MKEEYLPRINISKTEFIESGYVRGNKRWQANTLYKYVKSKKIKPFKYPLACFDLTNEQKWMNRLNCLIFCEECKRVFDCDINIPIILDDTGQVADGYHRIFKSFILNKKYIMAYKLDNMPAPDEIIKEE